MVPVLTKKTTEVKRMRRAMIGALAAALASPVVAPASGSVSFSGNVPGSGTSITIQTSDGYSVTLTHLGSASVRRGSDVREGDLLGTIGPSGTVEHDVPYVHLGVRRSEDPNGYVDPLRFLPARPAPAAIPPPPPARTPPPPPASPPPAAPPSAAAPPIPVPAPPVASPPPGRTPHVASSAAPAPEATVREHGQARTATAAPRTASVARSASRRSTGARPARATAADAPTGNSTPSQRQTQTPHPRGRQHVRAPQPSRSQSRASHAPRLDAIVRATDRAMPPRRGGALWPWLEGLAGGLVPLGIAALGGRGGRSGSREPAPIISSNAALLPDDTDLLRELDPAHRARVHDDRRRHRRAAPAPARRRDVLSDGDGRERDEERPSRGGSRCRREDVRRPARRRTLAPASRPRGRDARLLHSHDR